MKICSRLLPLVSLSLLGVSAEAKIKLPAVISDHMVLQQEANVNLWGWAEPGEKITAKFADKSVQTVAGPDKKWRVRLGNLKAGTKGDLTISGEDTVTVKDVLVGEVWVASGQSNMEWIVKNSANADQEIAAAKYPEIRMFTVTKDKSLTPKEDCAGTWQVSSPETAGAFSAVGYYFARELHKKLNVPVGVIHTSWGGTPAEFWTPTPIIEREPALKKYAERWKKVMADYPKAKEAYDANMAKWQEAAEKAKAEGKPAPRQPSAPRGSDAFGAPGCLWNAMVEPLLGYTIQGAIWYQGESNANGEDAKLYRLLFPTMILSWRQAWSQGGLAGSDNPDFPFLFVQLANYMQRYDQPVDSDWAVLRESQLLTLELPRTGMAVTIDIGEANDIHPKNKQEVGRRLALSALAQVYYIDMEFSGPIYSGSQPEDEKIRLSFRNADGLKAADGGKIKGFAIAGEDKKFVWANVSIEGDHVLVSSPDVPKPVAVRYGWANNPDCNLVNSAGLPASPFRTDDWPQQLPPPAPK